ncbi:wolframin isoform X2 [Ceratitis capitata]|uniref:wolframin isoform X2 n=1 Tax=Ceratitis capitata TaxID=7213 RepID=UPI000329FB04|nr:wolframin isoform X2 [Ceratitis capitata]
MASWSKNQPSGNSTRRKWKLEDRTSLNNLKYHIAAEGCSDVQYDLAKQLLDNTIEQNETTSSQQAIHWLLRASQQGHEDATKLLRQCFDEGCGITTENESEVRCCLSMTPGERAARKAARELFSCLSNGSEHITPRQLERKMREIYNLQKKRRHHGYSTSTSEEETEDEYGNSEHEPLTDAAAVGNGHVNLSTRRPRQRQHRRRVTTYSTERQTASGRVITEENLVSAAVNYAAGRMPAVNDDLTISVPHPATLDHVPCFHRLLFHPILFCTILYHRLVNLLASFPTMIPPSVRMALLFTVYWLASSENLTVFLPVGFYYLCLTVMICSTCKMLKTKQDFIDFRIWSGLFLSYGDHNVEANISENLFLKNNLKPYLYFFCAFIGSLMVSPLVAKGWLAHSELTIVSCIFVFVSLVVFMYSSARRFPDWIVLVSFGVNVLAKYPYEMDDVVATGWRFLDLKVPTFCSFVIGNGIEFCLNCRTALYLLIPGFLIHLAARSNWHGIYTHLIPHCVTLSWLQLCITTSQSATMFGMVRATLGLAGILLFLPLFGLVSLLIPVFVAIDWMGFTDPGVRLGSALIAAILALLGSCFLAMNRTTQRYVTILQVVLCIITACILTFPYMTANFKDSPRFGNVISIDKHESLIESVDNSESVEAGLDNMRNLDNDNIPHISGALTWQRFYTLCEQPANEQNNKIKTQLRCAHLEGMAVTWIGTATQAQISHVSNIRAEYISKYLPNWLSNLIRCVYGKKLSEQLRCSPKEETQFCLDLDHLLEHSELQGKCSLHEWNSYEYEIRVRMPTQGLLSKSSEIVLQASHKFGNFTRSLTAGDRLQFYGTLQNSRPPLANGLHERKDFILGASQPRIKLLAVKCVLCADKTLKSVSVARKSPLNARMRDLMRGIKYLLNVLFNPLITFK